MEKKRVSIVIPVYNEQDNLLNVYNQVSAILRSLPHFEHEFVFINDGSVDASWRILAQLAQADEHVKAINFSRNFGHQAALTAGYDIADGDAVVSMDADLQDPPTLLLEMIKAWESGAEIVYARRINRSDSLLKRITAVWYYKILDAVSDVRIPRNVGDFRLIDKKVAVLIRNSTERSRYLRGMVAWTGFKHAFIDFERPNRIAGQSGYTWKKMFKLAFDGLTSFSTFLLKIPLLLAIFILVCGVAMIGYCSATMAFYGASYSIATWLAMIMFNCMGLQFLCIWFLGEYVGRIYDQQKGRSLYIVAEQMNVGEQEHASQYCQRTNASHNKEKHI